MSAKGAIVQGSSGSLPVQRFAKASCTLTSGPDPSGIKHSAASDVVAGALLRSPEGAGTGHRRANAKDVRPAMAS